jgi:hypothetical protein
MASRTLNFELHHQGRNIPIRIEPHLLDRVLLDGKCIGHSWVDRDQPSRSRAVCEDLDGRRYAAKTREDAAAQMAYAVLRGEGRP